MGSDAHAVNEAPSHVVWVDAFSIALFAVTNADYAHFLRAAEHDAPPFWGADGLSDALQPVVGPSWYDAVAYCDWVSDMTGASYRLPTEAEREKGALGGLTTAYPWGDALPEEHRGGRQSEPEPVGSYAPNGFGLYGMASGVHEWCADWFAADYYAISPARNPQGPPSAERKVARGGSWRHHVRFTRCSARSALAPDKQFSDFGFRVATSGAEA